MCSVANERGGAGVGGAKVEGAKVEGANFGANLEGAKERGSRSGGRSDERVWNPKSCILVYARCSIQVTEAKYENDP